MGECSRKDIISDLPQGIIDSILTKLSIRDAVKTSILSTKWRYQWATMTQLVFDEKMMLRPDGGIFTRKELVNFITRCLLLHDGPIQKFKLSTSYLKKTPDINQWLLYISRKDVKELVLDVSSVDPWFPAPTIIFSCQRLSSLTLCWFDVKPPLKFQGFLCLKYLTLEYGTVTLEVIENLISGCPLLECFKFRNCDYLALTVCAPNLKHLTVGGNFRDVYLEHTPLLAAISIDFFTEAWEGDVLRKVPVTYDCLKFIEIESINYEEMNEVLYVLHLLLQSPNLEELQILAETFRSAHYKAVDLDFWDKECPTDFTFKHLKIIKMSNVFIEHDMEFVKFVLGRSPVLEVMSVSTGDIYSGNMNMANEVLHFQRASPKVKIKFFE